MFKDPSFPTGPQCRHNRQLFECEQCKGPSLVSFAEATAFLSDEECDFDPTLFTAAEFLVDSTYVAGAGLFVTGTWDEPIRERAGTKQFAEALMNGGAAVSILPIDQILLDPTPRSVVSMIHDLAKREHGVRDAQGNPRAILISGFCQSQYLTQEGLERYMSVAENEEHASFTALSKKVDALLGKADQLHNNFLFLKKEEREILAAALLGRRFSQSSWQSLSKRKNPEDPESPMTFIICPREAIQVVVATETGKRRPSAVESDILFRLAEGLSNFYSE